VNWTKWLGTEGTPGSERPLWSFSIVTTPASKDFEWLHDRQPVILISEEDIAKWLDPNVDKWTNELSQLVQPPKAHPSLQWQATIPLSHR
jgi:putative SOS response-associated peptidase YedK